MYIYIGSDWTRLQVMKRVDEIFTCFNSLGSIRNHFTDLADIYISDADNCLNPTIVQVIILYMCHNVYV